MAKSIRSKSRRHNRAELRRKFSEPIIQKRQEKMAEILSTNMQQKSQGSILNLKNVFVVNSSSSDAQIDEAEGDVAVEEEAEDDNKDIKKVAAKLLLKEKLKALKSSKKQKSEKELVWFK
jgi:hypothetical protein